MILQFHNVVCNTRVYQVIVFKMPPYSQVKERFQDKAKSSSKGANYFKSNWRRLSLRKVLISMNQNDVKAQTTVICIYSVVLIQLCTEKS